MIYRQNPACRLLAGSMDGLAFKDRYMDMQNICRSVVACFALIIIFLVHVTADAKAPSRDLRDPSLRIYDQIVVGAYSGKSSLAQSGEVGIDDVYVLLGVPTQRQLVSYATNRKLGAGCAFLREGQEIFDLHDEPCDPLMKRKIQSNAIHLPQCAPTSALPRASTSLYFVFRDTNKGICLYVLPKTSAWSESNEKLGETAFALQATQPFWIWSGAVNAKAEGGLLNYFFPSAPYLYFNDFVERGRQCIGYPTAIAGLSAKAQLGEADEEINGQRVLWSYQYLVKTPHGFMCGDVHYRVDSISRVEGHLSDGTALVAGQRSVLRLRVTDGSTTASPRVVKRVSPRAFVEQLQADGSPACLQDSEIVQCKWLAQQGWYSYRDTLGAGPEADNRAAQDYGKYWLQGFDRAIQRIFF